MEWPFWCSWILTYLQQQVCNFPGQRMATESVVPTTKLLAHGYSETTVSLPKDTRGAVENNPRFGCIHSSTLNAPLLSCLDSFRTEVFDTNELSDSTPPEIRQLCGLKLCSSSRFLCSPVFAIHPERHWSALTVNASNWTALDCFTRSSAIDPENDKSACISCELPKTTLLVLHQ
jgi:hypothetical protein